LHKSQRQKEARVSKVLIQLQSFQKLFNRSIVLPRQVEDQAERRVYDQREGIDFMRSLQLSDGFFKPPHGRQILAVPVVSGSIIRIQLNSVLVFSFSAKPAPFVGPSDISQGDVSFRDRVVDFQSLLGR